MRDFRERVRKLEDRVTPKRVECKGNCAGYRMMSESLDPRDKDTGQLFRVCSVDKPVWRAIKGTEWPETLREYQEFREAFITERALAHTEAKSLSWRAGRMGYKE